MLVLSKALLLFWRQNNTQRGRNQHFLMLRRLIGNKTVLTSGICSFVGEHVFASHHFHKQELKRFA